MPFSHIVTYSGNFDSWAHSVAEQDASWKQRYLNLARDAAELLIESGFMSDALLRAIAIYIIACLKIQASAVSLDSVPLSWFPSIPGGICSGLSLCRFLVNCR